MFKLIGKKIITIVNLLPNQNVIADDAHLPC